MQQICGISFTKTLTLISTLSGYRGTYQSLPNCGLGPQTECRHSAMLSAPCLVESEQTMVFTRSPLVWVEVNGHVGSPSSNCENINHDTSRRITLRDKLQHNKAFPCSKESLGLWSFRLKVNTVFKSASTWYTQKICSISTRPFSLNQQTGISFISQNIIHVKSNVAPFENLKVSVKKLFMSFKMVNFFLREP